MEKKKVISSGKMLGHFIGSYIAYGVVFGIPLVLLSFFVISNVTVGKTTLELVAMLSSPQTAVVLFVSLLFMSVLVTCLSIFFATKSVFKKRTIRRDDVNKFVKILAIFFIFSALVSTFSETLNWANLLVNAVSLGVNLILIFLYIKKYAYKNAIVDESKEEVMPSNSTPVVNEKIEAVAPIPVMETKVSKDMSSILIVFIIALLAMILIYGVMSVSKYSSKNEVKEPNNNQVDNNNYPSNDNNNSSNNDDTEEPENNNNYPNDDNNNSSDNNEVDEPENNNNHPTNDNNNSNNNNDVEQPENNEDKKETLDSTVANKLYNIVFNKSFWGYFHGPKVVFDNGPKDTIVALIRSNININDLEPVQICDTEYERDLISKGWISERNNGSIDCSNTSSFVKYSQLMETSKKIFGKEYDLKFELADGLYRYYDKADMSIIWLAGDMFYDPELKDYYIQDNMAIIEMHDKANNYNYIAKFKISNGNYYAYSIEKK